MSCAGIARAAAAVAEASYGIALAVGAACGCRDIRLFHNGKALSDEGTRGVRVKASAGVKSERTFKGLLLVPGMNELKAIAWSHDRVESAPAIARIERKAAKPSSVLHVLAIGVNAHKNGSYALTGARPDAERVAKILERSGTGIIRAPRRSTGD